MMVSSRWGDWRSECEVPLVTEHGPQDVDSAACEGEQCLGMGQRSVRVPGHRSGSDGSSDGGHLKPGDIFPSLEVPEYFVKDLQDGLAAVLAANGTWS